MYYRLVFVHISRHLFSFIFTLKNIIVNWETWIASHPFPCSFLLAAPRRWRAFWADLSPFVDTRNVGNIPKNYRDELSCQATKTKKVNLVKKSVFSPDYGSAVARPRRLPVSTKGAKSAHKTLRWWGSVRRKEQRNWNDSIQVSQLGNIYIFSLKMACNVDKKQACIESSSFFSFGSIFTFSNFFRG